MCRATNSECICILVRNGAGYLCQCSSSYERNPYIEGGCQIITLLFEVSMHFNFFCRLSSQLEFL